MDCRSLVRCPRSRVTTSWPRWGGVIGLAACALIGACGGDGAAPRDDASDAIDPRIALLPPSLELALPTIAADDPDGDGVVDRFQATFPRAILPSGHRLVRTLGYAREGEGYRGAIALDFAAGPSAPTPFEHVETLPKALAATVDHLAFSHPPVVLEADPRVAWTITDPDGTAIDITATTLVASPDAAGLSGEALAEYCLGQCDALAAGSEDAVACTLSVVQRFPDSQSVQDFVATCVAGEGVCAVVRALATGDWQTHCGGLPEADARACWVAVFNARADDLCRAARGQGDAAVAECLLAAWQRIGDETCRDLLCFDLGFQLGISTALDWSAFGELCAASTTRERCEAIADLALRARCLSTLARAAGDIAKCDALPPGSPYGPKECRWDFIRLLFDRPEACTTFSDPEAVDMCRAILATRDGDPDACLAIADVTLRNACIATAITFGPGYTDPSICEQIQREDGEYGEDERQWKHDYCVMLVAGYAMDAALCERVEDPVQRAACKVIFALVAEEPVRACGEAPGPVFQCLCLGLAGEARRDRRICEALTPERARLACITQALATTPPDTDPLEEACAELCVDGDGDEYFRDLGCHTGVDCDDADLDVHPGDLEACDDAKDNDCDGAIDCDDPFCATTPACRPTGQSEVVFTEHSGAFQITLTFPEGQGTGYRFVPEAELGYSVYGTGELVLVELAGYPRESSEWPTDTVPVVVSITTAAPLEAWRLYPASNASDPASRSTSTWWENTSEPIPMRGDRFYWLYIHPATGPYAQEVLRLEGQW